MNQPFLSAYQKLSQNASQSPFWQQACGYLHDVSLFIAMAHWKNATRVAAAANANATNGYRECKSWQDILGELNSLSLFDDSKVVIAHGNYKPDKANLAELEAFASQNRASQNPTNCLIVLMPKQDKKSQTTAFSNSVKN